MTLRLEYAMASNVPLEVEGILPAAIAGKSLAEIERLAVYHGNTQRALGEFFRVSGDPSDAHMVWEGDLGRVHWIGAGMTEGAIRVEGDVGRHLGSGMRGGQILVTGDAGDWVGGEMRGGLIRVQGSAGHLVGAAYRGSARGMTGGTILIGGCAGNEIGRSMRRGLLAVGGDAGDLVGFRMLAGTILIAGHSGIRHGAGMRRGTLVFLGERPRLLPTFRLACRYRPLVVSLLGRHLQRLRFDFPDELFSVEFELYHGDLLEGGRGELLVKTNQNRTAKGGCFFDGH